ncbi:hypothetical protein PMZ80_010288 [Knufia obscura]|uniref:Protein kinase domain-containing protein n=1 Tax=Knufia obscura TaxID=1635080 RepID=A0ABR0RAL9_9EURO|nr:hypothetical protein PMZ80_010288 [Knufia obscura]
MVNKDFSRPGAPQSLNITTLRRPSVIARTFSSPPTPHTPSKTGFARTDLNMLTPPSSPPRAGSSSELKVAYESLETLRSSVDTPRTSTYTSDGIISCPYDVGFVKDQNDRKQMFGYGAWSNVFKASCHAKAPASHGLLTPPCRSTAPPLLVAVKTPARKDAMTILRHEAQILSRLRELDINEDHIAAFHGIIDDESSLVLAAHPLSLEDHIKTCARTAQTTTTTASISSPVFGSAAIWLDLADKLITTLDWMHNEASIVHGDIKPGNILLRPTPERTDDNTFPYQPLFIDFSSSQRLDTTSITPNTLSAVTMEYTAPELLTVAVLKDPNSCATTASDVFSLAVTLLVAATGDPMVYTGYSGMQRQMLATQGWGVLNNVRSLSSRVPRQGIVSRVLEKAVLKKDMGRISTGAWIDLVKDARKDMAGQTKL